MQAQHIEFLKLLNGDVQYIVPRWQRRYCWGKADIERLVEDLLAIAGAGPDATHYGGTLLTFPEPSVAGKVVSTYRVVDGQQRLTTVSILLAAIANRLEMEGPCRDWTESIIRKRRLTNPDMTADKLYKLKLQKGDEEEFRLILEGNPGGSGSIFQAWRTVNRLVERCDVDVLLRGLERLRVVSIGLESTDDPQQIFESLNATGRPLTESEKVKNWLLIGLPEEEQRNLHDNYWLKLEKTLGAEYTSEPIDLFLRDFMRWRMGNIYGSDKTYEQLRRWALKNGLGNDRPELCRDIASLGKLYGYLTGAAGNHCDKRISSHLKHLRELGMHVHRPLTLRLLHDYSQSQCDQEKDFLAGAIGHISSWLTRTWLANRPTAGLNSAMAELAHSAGPDSGSNILEHWLGAIRKLRNTRAGVPSDEEVRNGIRTRKAYGGSATQSTFAVLCALMEADKSREAPAQDNLTVEHVMPQKLTEEWRRDLGEDALEIHGRYRDRLGNLTLTGFNPELGAKPFKAKKEIYRDSGIQMTRRIAEKEEWDEDAIERRAEELAEKALNLWPWPDQASFIPTESARSSNFKWRMSGKPWMYESVGAQLVFKVAAALLDENPGNAEKLSGDALFTNVHPANRHPAGSVGGADRLRKIPGHEDYVLFPYQGGYPECASFCRKMGERCGIEVEVEILGEEYSQNWRFWRFLKEKTGGLPGQKDHWRGRNQWANSGNDFDDWIGINVGNPDRLWLYVLSGNKKSENSVSRMKAISRIIRNQMADQEITGDMQSESELGRSLSVQRDWVRDDENDWPEAAQWIMDQHERLRKIATEFRFENG